MSLMEDIQKDERAAALEKSIHCALLAPAGVQRTRLLATFYKDERSNKFSCYSLLEKMFKEGSSHQFYISRPIVIILECNTLRICNS